MLISYYWLEYQIAKLPVPTTQATFSSCKVRSYALLRTLLVYQKSSSDTSITNYGYLSYGHSNHNAGNDMKARGYFSKPKGIREQNIFFGGAMT